MGKRTHGPYLLVAIDNNNIRAVKEILALHIKAKSKVREICVDEIKRRQSNHHDCPLMQAAKLHDPSVFRYLLERDVNVNHIRQCGFGRHLKIETALIVSCRNGNFDTAALILSANCMIDVQDHKGRTALHYAVRSANFRLSKLLLSRGAQCNISDNAGNAPIHIATKYGHFELAKLLIQYGADLYKKGEDSAIPVHMAAKEGHVGLVKLFCCSDVNINTKVPCYDRLREKAPIHVACEEGHSETVTAMIEQFGADMYIRDSDGETPLHCTVISPYDTSGMKSKDDYTETARVLIMYGVDVNIRNGRGETPLHLAARNEYQRITELLVAAGANPNIPDNDSNKPIDLVSVDDAVTKQIIKNAMEKQNHLDKIKIDNAVLVNMDGESSHIRSKAMSTTNISGVNRQLFGRTVSTPGLYVPVHRHKSQTILNKVNDGNFAAASSSDEPDHVTRREHMPGRYKRAISFDCEMLKSHDVEDPGVYVENANNSRAKSFHGSDVYIGDINHVHNSFEETANVMQTLQGRRAFSASQIPEDAFGSFRVPPHSPTSPLIPHQKKKHKYHRSTSAVMEECSDSDSSSLWEISPLTNSKVFSPFIPKRSNGKHDDFQYCASGAASKEFPSNKMSRVHNVSPPSPGFRHTDVKSTFQVPSPTQSLISAPTPPPDQIARPPGFCSQQEYEKSLSESDISPDGPIYKNIDYYTSQQDIRDFDNKTLQSDDAMSSCKSGLEDQPFYTNEEQSLCVQPVLQKSQNETTDDESYFDDSSFSDEDFQEQDNQFDVKQVEPPPRPSLPYIPPPPNHLSPHNRKSREALVPPVSMKMIEEENSDSESDTSEKDKDLGNYPSVYHVPKWDCLSSDSGSLIWENPECDDFIGILRSTNSTPIMDMTVVPSDSGHHAASNYLNSSNKVSKTNIVISFKDKGTKQDDIKKKFVQTQTTAEICPPPEQPTRKHFVPALPVAVAAEMADRLQNPISQQVMDEYKFNRAIGSLNAVSTESLERHVEDTTTNLRKVQNRQSKRPMSPPPLPPKVVQLAQTDTIDSGYKDMSRFIRNAQVPPVPDRNARVMKSTPPPFTDLTPHTSSQLSIPEQTSELNSNPASPVKENTGAPLMQKSRPPPEPRTVSFITNGKIGIKIIGGTKDGIFVSTVEGGSPAENNGITGGDQLVSVNGEEIGGKTREDALLILMGLQGHICLVVQNDMERYEKIIQNGGAGDSFHIRTNYTFERMRDNELSFTIGEVFNVTDTLPEGQIGNWRVTRVQGTVRSEHREGYIPNASRAEQIALLQQKLNTQEDGKQKGNVFRRSLRKTKSTEKLDRLSYVSSNVVIVPYERVEMKPFGFVRPVVLLGAVADIVTDKLVDDRPERFVSMNVGVDGSCSDWSAQNEDQTVKLYDERPIRFSIKHCVFTASPATIEYLRDASLCPIVIFLKGDNKSVIKTIRTRYGHEGKKVINQLYDEANALEKDYSDLFTAVVNLSVDDQESWYSLLLDTIDRLQKQELWLPVVKGADSRPSSIAIESRRASISSTRSDPPGNSPPAPPAPSRTEVTSPVIVSDRMSKLASPYEIAQLHSTEIHAYEDIEEMPAHIRKSLKSTDTGVNSSDTDKQLENSRPDDDLQNQYVEGQAALCGHESQLPTYAVSAKQREVNPKSSQLTSHKENQEHLSHITEERLKKIDVLSYMNGPVNPQDKIATKRNFVDQFDRSPSKSILKNRPGTEHPSSDPLTIQQMQIKKQASKGYHPGMMLTSVHMNRKPAKQTEL